MPSMSACVFVRQRVFVVRIEHLIRGSSIPVQDLCFVMGRWVKCIAFGVTSSKPFTQTHKHTHTHTHGLFHWIPSFSLQTDYTGVSGHAVKLFKCVCLVFQNVLWPVGLWVCHAARQRQGKGAPRVVFTFVCARVCVFSWETLQSSCLKITPCLQLALPLRRLYLHSFASFPWKFKISTLLLSPPHVFDSFSPLFPIDVIVVYCTYSKTNQHIHSGPQCSKQWASPDQARIYRGN